MAEGPMTPIVIGAVVGVCALVTGGFYYFLFAMFAGTVVLRWVIVAGSIALIAALTVVVRRRIVEIKEVNPDDYRNY